MGQCGDRGRGAEAERKRTGRKGWGPAAVALAARRVASFGTWVALSEIRALSGAFRVRFPAGSGSGGVVFGQPE